MDAILSPQRSYAVRGTQYASRITLHAMRVTLRALRFPKDYRFVRITLYLPRTTAPGPRYWVPISSGKKTPQPWLEALASGV
jgi:hypothetical protein